MKFKNKATTIGWFILAFIPLANFYWVWRVSKLVSHIED